MENKISSPENLTIIEKLKQINDTDKKAFDNWSLEEIHELLDVYFTISKKEAQIFGLIYRYHGCDSWEDIFRDYKKRYLKDKADGVAIAIEAVHERMNAATQSDHKTT